MHRSREQVLHRILFITTLLLGQVITVLETKTIGESTDRGGLSYHNGPEFIGPVQNLTVAIGREATFSCSISNIGKYKVGWLRASDKMIISLHTRTVIQNERIVVKYDHADNFKSSSSSQEQCNHKSSSSSGCGDEVEETSNGTWHLIIRNTKESDKGCYMCQINTSPMISQIGCLDILVSPDILNNETSADLSVVEGENATLVCKAVGKPPPRILWKREDGQPILLRTPSYSSVQFHEVPSFNDSRLVLQRADRKQMGTYLCIASNDVHPAVSKRVTLSVNFSPSVQAMNQLLGAPVGTDVILECSVEAHPNTVNYWLKNPNKMLLEGPKYTIKEKREGYKVDMILIIRQFKEDDIGSYSCISSNSLGKVEGVSRLYKIDDINSNKISHASHHYPASDGIADSAQNSGGQSMISAFEYCQLLVLIIKAAYLLTAIS
ncbi:neurotrimin-like isoform X1 [Trichogramma pretiosum]|uniref:neurotrimin-like isoform X1 n=1 Tax=Trichogramma pretiosum TaxID=7493 RepID=UPI0006C9AA56|nr:neurotrimin-like isoform X1 [Trichogramma pretiosum]